MTNALPHDSFLNKRVLVVGLGRFGGGTGVSRWLVEQGARVTVTDQADEASLVDSRASLRDLDIEYRLGGHDDRDLEGIDLAVINPAVDKGRSSFFGEIQQRGIPWTTELNLFCERCLARVVGVTGTYGKSTTGAMLQEILAASCRAGLGGFTQSHFGGNIGRSLLSELEHIRPTDIVVLEMSNAQLEDLPLIVWRPEVAVITNLHPHHLERHGSFENYVRAKLNILQKIPPDNHSIQNVQPVILGDVDARAAGWLNNRLSSHVHRVTRVTPPEDPIALCVPGWHNQVNAASALTAARVLGMNEGLSRAALAVFPGLPHRVELVATLDGVAYFNDSKSTSPSATVAALGCFDRPVVAIVGGQRKAEFDYAGCATLLLAKCRAVVCTGESRQEIGQALDRAVPASDGKPATHPPSSAELMAGVCKTVPHNQLPYQGALPVAIHKAATLDEAVAIARSLAHPGDVVLYSPGAPSFDTHVNYSKRGEAFCAIVRNMR